MKCISTGDYYFESNLKSLSGSVDLGRRVLSEYKDIKTSFTKQPAAHVCMRRIVGGGVPAAEDAAVGSLTSAGLAINCNHNSLPAVQPRPRPCTRDWCHRIHLSVSSYSLFTAVARIASEQCHWITNEHKDMSDVEKDMSRTRAKNSSVCK